MKKQAANTSAVRTENKSTGKVVLEGELALANAGAIKSKLVDALQRYQELEVVVQNVMSIDLSFLQLLCGLSRTSRVLNKKVAFDIRLSPETDSLLTKTGFRSRIEKENLK